MSDGIRFRMNDCREIARVFAEVLFACGLAFVALITILLVMLLTWPALPAAGTAIVAALLIRFIVRWLNIRDDQPPPTSPSKLSA